MNTFDELKLFVNQQNIVNTYTCEDNTVCKELIVLSTAEGLQKQIHPMITAQTYFRVYWLEYNKNINEFVLNLSFFNPQQNIIDVDQFFYYMKSNSIKNSTNDYINDGQIRWIKSTDIIEYTPAREYNSSIYKSLKQKLNKINLQQKIYPTPTPPYYG